MSEQTDTISFKIVGFVHLEGKATDERPLPRCENCGHEIRNVFTIKSDDGRRMTVGSECVSVLTARTPAHTEAARIIKRVTRAGTQWRKGVPAAFPLETKEQYITRRIAEMGNAMKAYKAWAIEHTTLFTPKFTGNGWAYTYDHKVEGRCKRLGLSYTRTEVEKRHRERIARKYGANIYDFSRPSWDVVKL